MPVINAWAGAQLPTSFRVAARCVGTSARLAVSSVDSTFGAATYYGPLPIDGNGSCAFTATGLPSATRHSYALEVDGVLDLSWVGTITTAPVPGEQTSFQFLVMSCAAGVDGSTAWPPGVGYTGVSNRFTFATMAATPSEFLIHLGDIAYRNIAVNDPQQFRQQWDDVLSAPNQALLYRAMALDYMADDHDSGPDNHNSSSPSVPAYKQVYREQVPSYPLTDPSGLWQSWVFGRCRFILCDLRSERDPQSKADTVDKTMTGAAQEAWFTDIIRTCTEPVIFFLSTVCWHVPTVTGADAWHGYNTQRQRLAAVIETYAPNRVIVLSGDTHVSGLDDGRSNVAGTFPEFQCSAVDSGYGNGQLNGGWSHGFTGVAGLYGLVAVEDQGEIINVTLSLMGDSGLALQLSVIRRTMAPLHLGEPLATKAFVGGSLVSVVEKASSDLSVRPFKTWVAMDLSAPSSRPPLPPAALTVTVNNDGTGTLIADASLITDHGDGTGALSSLLPATIIDGGGGTATITV